MPLPAKKVRALIALMNSTTSDKIPPLKPVMECFDLAMDENTLDFLLACGVEAHTLEELKQIYSGLYGQEALTRDWEGVWQNIREMSFFLPGEADPSAYQLASIFPGWIELSVSGELNEKRRAIILKFMKVVELLKTLNIGPIRMVMNLEGRLEKRTGKPHVTTYTGATRRIPVNRELNVEQQIYTEGDVYELLERNRDQLAVMHCICRTYKQLTDGGDCEFDLPIEGCINIGPLSRQLVENGISRKLTLEEAKTLVNQFERKGCVHTAFHYGSDPDREAINLCNCCKDCCLLYGGYNKGGLSRVFVKAWFSPKPVDETRCVGCNRCGTYCPTGATGYDREKKKLLFDYDACVGCGQCVTQCRFDVRELVPDERSVFAKTKKK